MGTTHGLISVKVLVLADLRKVVKLRFSRTRIMDTHFSIEQKVKGRMMES